jgi:hypothetical protein
VVNQAPVKLHEEVKSIRAEFALLKNNSFQPPKMVNHPSAIPIQSQTDTNSKIHFDGNVKPAESMYTPIPAQLQNNNVPSQSNIKSNSQIQEGSDRK